MRSYEVRVTPSAMAQIRDAVRYVRDELCMPQAAARLLDEIEEAVARRGDEGGVRGNGR